MANFRPFTHNLRYIMAVCKPKVPTQPPEGGKGFRSDSREYSGNEITSREYFSEVQATMQEVYRRIFRIRAIEQATFLHCFCGHKGRFDAMFLDHKTQYIYLHHKSPYKGIFYMFILHIIIFSFSFSGRSPEDWETSFKVSGP